jgi:glycosyltransferase involved in cell wall biosynthesis
MKVLLLTTSFPLRKGSRSGIFIQKMIEPLPAGIEVTVLVPDDSSRQVSLPSSCYTLVRFRYAPKGWQRLAHGDGGIMAAFAQNELNLLLLPPFLLSSFLMTCWHARKADVIHANWSINGFFAGIAGLIFNKPVITTLRGSDVNLAEKSWLMRQLAGSCLNHSQAVVTVSPALKQILSRQFSAYAHKINVIANGLDQAFFTAGQRRTAENGLVRFLYAGNLVPGKGVQVILEAAAALPEKNWVLEIVGDGPEREKLTTFCQEKGIRDKVRFHGSVAPAQIPDLMGRADAFVFASFAEGRPNAVLEAMAAGLPTLAAAIPAVKELIVHGKEGLLFPPGDKEKLAEYMALLASDPAERRRLGENARSAMIALGLSWPETARQYATLYQQAIGQKRYSQSDII